MIKSALRINLDFFDPFIQLINDSDIGDLSTDIAVIDSVMDCFIKITDTCLDFTHIGEDHLAVRNILCNFCTAIKGNITHDAAY